MFLKQRSPLINMKIILKNKIFQTKMTYKQSLKKNKNDTLKTQNDKPNINIVVNKKDINKVAKKTNK